MRTFEEIQLIVRGRLTKARLIVQEYNEKKERERQKPPTPVPPSPNTKPTKTNGKAR